VVCYLWRQIESEVAATGEVVLHEEGNLGGQADLDLVGESRGLAEVDQVLEGEGQRDRLAQLDVNVQLGLLYVGVASEGDGTVADISSAGKLDAILAGIDSDWKENESSVIWRLWRPMEAQRPRMTLRANHT
jgi:hypothetical protein